MSYSFGHVNDFPRQEIASAVQGVIARKNKGELKVWTPPSSVSANQYAYNPTEPNVMYALNPGTGDNGPPGWDMSSPGTYTTSCTDCPKPPYTPMAESIRTPLLAPGSPGETLPGRLAIPTKDSGFLELLPYLAIIAVVIAVGAILTVVVKA